MTEAKECELDSGACCCMDGTKRPGRFWSNVKHKWLDDPHLSDDCFEVVKDITIFAELAEKTGLGYYPSPDFEPHIFATENGCIDRSGDKGKCYWFFDEMWVALAKSLNIELPEKYVDRVNENRAFAKTQMAAYSILEQAFDDSSYYYLTQARKGGSAEITFWTDVKIRATTRDGEIYFKCWRGNVDVEETKDMQVAVNALIDILKEKKKACL